MKVKIYLASRFTSRKRLCEKRDYLQAKGFVVTSRWLNASDERPEPGTENWKRFACVTSAKDLQDIVRADVLVLDLLDGHATRSGEFVELGIALGLTKFCIVIGETDNTFTFHPLVKRLDNWLQVYTELQLISEEFER